MSGTDDYVSVVAFLLICAILLIGRWAMRLFAKLDEPKVDNESQQHRGYGINYMMRRRRLDVTNPNSSFRTSVGTKIRKQRTGLFRRRRK
jgi:hypothetical protein